MATKIIEKIQKPSQAVNEERVIDDTIFELTGGDEVAEFFRTYDRIKSRIAPGKILKNGDGVTIANEAEYATHAYLVANSKNFLTGESMLYTVSDVNALSAENLILSSSYTELQAQSEAAFTMLEGFQEVLNGLNETLKNVMASGSNIPQEVLNYYTTLNNFAVGVIDTARKGLQFSENDIYLSDVSVVDDAAQQDFNDAIEKAILSNAPSTPTTSSSATTSSNPTTSSSSTTTTTSQQSVPILISPTNGEFVWSWTPTFTWTTINGVTSYQIQVTPDSSFNTLSIDLTVPGGSSYTPSKPLDTQTTYYWRVRGINVAASGTWSSVFVFTTPPRDDSKA